MTVLTQLQRLKLIGCSLSEPIPENPTEHLIDIEKTFLDVLTSFPFMQDHSRMMTVLLSWVEVHGWCLNSAKMLKMLQSPEYKNAETSYLALTAAFATGCKLKNWIPLLKQLEPSALREFPALTDNNAIQYRGKEQWAEKFDFQIAKGSLATNPKWVMSRKELAQVNTQYKNRLLYGADWRADVVTAIQMGATRPSTIVKWIGISYEPAHRIFEDLKDAGLIRDERLPP
ncbi:MAG: hypothetical protein EOP04_04605 [Proteobacteria bacterium]|nr:MAG: hypothetical protein EOP04_04605 [Pseudomonadota bacterium]